MDSERHEKLWGFVGLLLIVFLVYYFARNLRYIESLIQHAGIAGPLVVILLYGVFAITPISTDPLTIVSGAMFGPVAGIIISWIGNNVAAMVEYFFGRHMRNVTDFDRTKKKLPFGLDKVSFSSPWFLILGRLIPGYGGKVISILAGMHHVPIITYIWTTGITNLAGSLLLSFGGYHFIHFLRF